MPILFENIQSELGGFFWESDSSRFFLACQIRIRFNTNQIWHQLYWLSLSKEKISGWRKLRRNHVRSGLFVEGMVFIIDGCSFLYAYTLSKSGISNCWRHLVTSKESSNLIFFLGNSLFYIIRAHHVLSCHLIWVPWFFVIKLKKIWSPPIRRSTEY